MIIINIIILYFIQITHTDDFPSTGTRPVYLIGPLVILPKKIVIVICMHGKVRVRVYVRLGFGLVCCVVMNIFLLRSIVW